MKQVFGTVEFDWRGYVKNSFVLVAVEKNRENRRLVTMVLLLLRMSAPNRQELEEFEFPQYMECTTPLESEDAFLSCTCAQWSTYDEMDRTAECLRG